jgi:hypothetical protein
MLAFFCGDTSAALEQGAIRNPERPGYMNRFVVWCRGKATGGNARSLCTCQDDKTAQCNGCATA